MSPLPAAAPLAEQLQLVPHPEGGLYREFLPGERIGADWGIPDFVGKVTLVYFLLERREILPFHSVPFDETWHLCAGGPLEVHTISPAGEYSLLPLAYDIGAGYTPDLMLYANDYRALRLAPGAEWALAICARPPHKDFANITPTPPAELLQLCPDRGEVVLRLAREF